MSQSTPNVNDLFSQAADEGALSQASKMALTVVDAGAQINAALGIPSQQVQASEVFLVGVLLDDSSSISSAGNTQIVRDGHNSVVEALRGSKTRDSILMLTRRLNGGVVNPFSTLENVELLNDRNYNPYGLTPLRDQIGVVLGTVLAKYQDFANYGVPARTATLIVTDGHDEGSVQLSDAQVAAIVRDLLGSEMHIIAAMGIDDGQTDFRAVFRSYGIRDNWILTPGNSASEIRKAFQVFSQSAVRASQTAASFSQTALGGFGN